MKLTLIGTGTCKPDPARTPACYILESDDVKILIDPGPGAVNRITAAGIDPFDIDLVAISHFHLDHISDLLYYLFAYKNCSRSPKHDLNIIGPIGFGDFFQRMSEPFAEWIDSAGKYAINVLELGGEPVILDNISITSLPMNHGANSMAYRFDREDGKSFLYSGDTAFCDNLVTLCKGVDLALIECTFGETTQGEGHMRPKDIANVGRQSGITRIALTHFFPELDTTTIADSIKSAGFGGEIIIGEDNMQIDI